MTKRLFLLLFFAPFMTASAATAPGTDIWLVDLDVSKEHIAADNPRNLTRRGGYDNQPAFLTAHSFLFTAMDASGQTDIWRHDLADGSTTPMLPTPESEYSPLPVPGGEMSVVRVALNGVQQLWTFAPGKEDYQLLFPMLEGVGYHAWVDADRVALFMVRNPPELHIANRDTGKVVVLAKDIGRCLQVPPGGGDSIAFVEAGQDGGRWIKRLDLEKNRLVALAPVLEGSEDFAFLPDGRILMARQRALFAWSGETWQEIARFDALPGAITRLAVGPDAKRLLMVVAEGE
ncbi:MAG TPA: hypothetical protein VF267_04265 [Gammaproteobacteria bacterium]